MQKRNHKRDKKWQKTLGKIQKHPKSLETTVNVAQNYHGQQQHFNYLGQHVNIKKGPNLDRFSKKMCTFCFCLFYVGERKRENMKNMEKENFKKSQKNSVLGVVVRKKERYFCGNGIFLNGQTLFVFRRCKNSAHVPFNYLFWENGPFLCPFKVTKNYKNRGFSRHGGKPKMARLVAKVPFGVFTICDTQSRALLKHYFWCFQ